jgi:putative chitinase
MTVQQLASCTGATILNASTWVMPLQCALDKWAIDTPVRRAMFLAQVGVESAHLTDTEENLHYSAARLMVVFRPHFKDLADAKAVALRGPQAIANRVYANRLGNGDEASGDGWRHRGAGLIELTGKTEQEAYLSAAGFSDAQMASLGADYLREPSGAADSAGWYWCAHHLSRFADAKDVRGCTEAVNGPELEGLAEREELFNEGLKAQGAA